MSGISFNPQAYGPGSDDYGRKPPFADQAKERQIRLKHIQELQVIKDLLNLGRKNDALTYINQRIKTLEGK